MSCDPFLDPVDPCCWWLCSGSLLKNCSGGRLRAGSELPAWLRLDLSSALTSTRASQPSFLSDRCHVVSCSLMPCRLQAVMLPHLRDLRVWFTPFAVQKNICCLALELWALLSGEFSLEKLQLLLQLWMVICWKNNCYSLCRKRHICGSIWSA